MTSSCNVSDANPGYSGFNLGRYGSGYETKYPELALYEIRGGSLGLADNVLMYYTTTVFRTIGPDPDVRISYFLIGNNNGNLEYILDGKPNHIAATYWNDETAGNLRRRGNLKVGLNGGILLARTNSFDLITSPSFTADDFAAKPDTNMWTTIKADDVDGTRDAVRITLTNYYKKASLDMNGTKAARFGALARGHVTLANINTNEMGEGLAVYLDVDAATYGNTLTNLAAQLVTAGYTNSAAETSGLRVVIPKTYMTTNNPNFFMWDFTDTSTGVTNATVNSLRFLNYPATPGTIITIQ